MQNHQISKSIIKIDGQCLWSYAVWKLCWFALCKRYANRFGYRCDAQLIRSIPNLKFEIIWNPQDLAHAPNAMCRFAETISVCRCSKIQWLKRKLTFDDAFSEITTKRLDAIKCNVFILSHKFIQTFIGINCTFHVILGGRFCIGTRIRWLFGRNRMHHL